MASEAVGGSGASGGGLAGLFYRTVMRRNSVYVAFVLGGALVTERMIDGGLNSLWASINRGVSCL